GAEAEATNGKLATKIDHSSRVCRDCVRVHEILQILNFNSVLGLIATSRHASRHSTRGQLESKLPEDRAFAISGVPPPKILSNTAPSAVTTKVMTPDERYSAGWATNTKRGTDRIAGADCFF